MRTSLSTRITAYFGALFLAAVAILFSLWYFGLPGFGLVGAGGARLAEATRTLEREADHQRAMVQTSITERRGDLVAIAENRTISQQLRDSSPLLSKDFERVATRLQRAFPDRFLDVLIAHPQTAKILVSTDSSAVGSAFAPRALIEQASRPGIKELVEEVSSRHGTTLAIVRHMRAPGPDGNPQGDVVGILVAIIEPQVLFASGYLSAQEQTNWAGRSYLFDSRGLALQPSPEEPQAIGRPLFNTQVVPGFEGTLQGTDAQGRPTIQVYRHLRLSSSVGWTLVHEISQDEALASLQDDANTLALIGIALTLTALGVIALASKKLTRSLRTLATTARQLGRGELTARVSLHASDPREIDLLSQAFNDMANSVERGHRELESAVQVRTAELATERDRAQGYLDIAGIMLLALDASGRIAMVNKAGARLLGHAVADLQGVDWFEQFIPAPERAAMRQVFDQLLRDTDHAFGRHESHIRNASGALRTLSWNNAVLRDATGKPIGVLSSAEDITERKAIDDELRIAAIAFESQEAMLVTDANWSILRVNHAFTRMSGYSAEEAVGKQPRDLLGTERQDEHFYEVMSTTIASEGSWQGEAWDRAKHGRMYPVWLIITAVNDVHGALTHYVATMTDITERKAAEEEIRNLAFYDALTGLPNRRLLMDRLEQAIAHAARSSHLGALLFVDMDDFKSLNDSQGHDVGDKLLQHVAIRLTSCTRLVDTVARLGGDEFVVLLENLSESAGEAVKQAEAVGEKILTALNQSYPLDGLNHHSSPSIGITLFGEHGESLNEPLKRADVAMYQAKAAGRNTLRFFDPQTQSAVNARVEMEADLRAALQQQQLVVHYQAQVTAGGCVTGAELLVRWQHPVRGMVPPADFIGLAETTGLILPLGAWVLEQACCQLVQWSTDAQLQSLHLSVNVSAQQFHDRGFVESVLGILDRTGADPQRLKLELTESLLVRNVEDVIAKMMTLKARGVGFALDDFGTGYSSLSYLKRLPLECLKIDQGFVRDILDDPNDAAIAKMVIALADSLSLGVIAEGVETQDQQEALQAMGCVDYQGYLYSRPVAVEAFEALVKRKLNADQKQKSLASCSV